MRGIPGGSPAPADPMSLSGDEGRAVAAPGRLDAVEFDTGATQRTYDNMSADIE